jgi:phage shock protein E
MIDLFKNLFGSKANIGDLIKNGAVIIDVRTRDEFKRGHNKNSVNIPLDKLTESLKKLDKKKPVITCCASGARSGTAASYLKSKGFEQVVNAGPWTSLRKYQD